jgi:glycosyltransferase involved in cell wall biosynthesis
MTVLLFGNYSTSDGYPRLRVLAAGLRSRGVQVVEARVPWLEEEGARERASSSAFGFLRSALSGVAGLWRLWRAYGKSPAHDVVLVGYPGHLAVMVARLRARRGRPIVLDAFLSLYDTVVLDRALASPGSLRARFLRTLDRMSCGAADVVLLDTEAHGRWFTSELGVPAAKIRRVLVGAERRPAAEGSPGGKGAPLEVLWFGTYVPLQGVGTVLEAAALLANADIRLTLIGRGQELGIARARAASLGLDPAKVRFVEEFLPRDRLEERIRAADVCLGIFGTTGKAGRVVPCKVYDALAAGRPVVTADTDAAREVLVDGETALLVPPGNAAALAAALRRLHGEPSLRVRLAAGARRLFEERLAPERVVDSLLEDLCPAPRTA